MTARPRWRIALAAGVMLVVLVAAFRFAGGDRAGSGSWIFEVELRASAGSFVQLFWTPGVDFVEEHSTRARIQAGGPSQTLRFIIPRGVRSLRLDPTDAAAEVLIGRMTLKEADGRVVATFGADSLTSPHQVASIARRDGGTVLVTSDNDPWVILAIGCLQTETTAGDRLVTGSFVALASATTIALIAACLLAIAVDVHRTNRAGALLFSGRRSLVWLPVVFLLVFSAKLLLVREFPITAPYWDQWDGEARALYLPYYRCDLSWTQMFQLHNEHRIFFTRLLALALLLLNGQWDPRLQQVVNAGLHALIAVLLLVMLWRGLEWRRLDLVAFLVIPLFALPFAWENALLGFQSAFYFFLLFSLLGLWLTTASRTGSPGWWLGCACALCGLFTAAGGILLPLVICGVAALEMINAPRRWRDLVLTVIAAGALLALGIATVSPPLAHHQALKAPTATIFLAAFFRNLAWPWVDHPVAGIVMWVPIAAWLGAIALRWGRTTIFERFIIGLAVWVVGQAAAIAYGRGGGWLVPATRYQDFLSLGFVTNTLALVTAVRHTPPKSLLNRAAIAVLVAWTGAAVVGLDSLTSDTLTTLAAFRPHLQAQAANVKRFVLSGDIQEFKSRPPQDLPYPNTDTMVDVLGQPIIRRILPAAVREPLRVVPRTITSEAFVPYGAYPTTPQDPMARGWGSYGARGNPALGDFESQPIASCESGGRLSVPVAGYLGLDRLSLAIRDEVSGATTPLQPDRLAREEWVNVTVRCPPGRFVIVATDGRPDFWFAFREPVEIGWGSIRAERMIGASVRLMLAALALTILAVKLT